MRRRDTARTRTIPLPKDVKQAINHYLKLDAARRRNIHSDDDDAFIFQPLMTGHKDIRMVVRYDYERGNLEENVINFLLSVPKIPS